jgi:integrase
MQYTKHLQIRKKTYHFRFKIPTELKSLTLKSEIVRSLKTDSFNDACVIIATKLPLLRQLKRMTSEQTTRNELQDLFDELTDFTDIDAYNRYQRFATSDEIQGMQTVADQVRSDLQDNQKSDFSDLIKTQSSTDIKRHKGFQRLFVRLVDTQTERATSGCTPIYDQLLDRANALVNLPLENKKHLLSEQYKEFRVFKSWSEKSTKNNNNAFDILLAHWGDVCVTTITKQQIKEAIHARARMPVKNKRPYNKMTFTELYQYSVSNFDDIPEQDFVASKTAKELHKLLQGFFSAYLTKEVDILEKSPTDNVIYTPVDVKGGDYTDSEVLTFEKHALAQAGWKKWALLLGMYTGARAGEIREFLKDGTKEQNGIHFFELKEGKTENAIRKIPVHQNLIDAGILGLPPTEIPDKAITNYTNQTRDLLSIPQLSESGNKRVFHAFRHTFITKAIAEGSTIELVQEVVGHAKQIGITDRYTHKLPLVNLLPVVNSVIYVD